jgi:hypothetical protein
LPLADVENVSVSQLAGRHRHQEHPMVRTSASC